jgi:hypothetical protein
LIPPNNPTRYFHDFFFPFLRDSTTRLPPIPTSCSLVVEVCGINEILLKSAASAAAPAPAVSALDVSAVSSASSFVAIGHVPAVHTVAAAVGAASSLLLLLPLLRPLFLLLLPHLLGLPHQLRLPRLPRLPCLLRLLHLLLLLCLLGLLRLLRLPYLLRLQRLRLPAPLLPSPLYSAALAGSLRLRPRLRPRCCPLPLHPSTSALAVVAATFSGAVVDPPSS